jgi:hypothetical protein
MNIQPTFGISINDWDGTDAFPPDGLPKLLEAELRDKNFLQG